MTAEIAIMNKLGVALAADSAATIGYQSGNKIYNSANKLFMLSAIHPIGVMIYGSAELTSVPWETIVKLYRTHLGKQKFAKLNDYVNHFFAFLNDSKSDLFPQEVQEIHLKSLITQYFLVIKQEIDDSLIQIANPTDKNVLDTLIKVIASDLQEIKTIPLLADLPSEYEATVREKIDQIFNDVYQASFDDLPMPDECLDNLKDKVLHL